MNIRYGIGFLAVVVLGVVFGQWYQGQVDRKISIDNLTTAHQAGLALLQYVQDHNERFPRAERWEDELAPYLKGMPLTLESRDGVPHRLAMNMYLSGRLDADLPEPSRVIALYETRDPHRNAQGAPTDALRACAWPSSAQMGTPVMVETAAAPRATFDTVRTPKRWGWLVVINENGK